MSSNIGTTDSHCLYSHRPILIENHLWNNPTWSKTLQLEMYTEIEQPLATGVLLLRIKFTVPYPSYRAF